MSKQSSQVSADEDPSARFSRKIGREEEEAIQHSFAWRRASDCGRPCGNESGRVLASTSCGLHSGLHELVIRYPRHSRLIGCDVVRRQVTRWAHAWIYSLWMNNEQLLFFVTIQ